MTTYCVTGMHKSGTTLVARMLHQSGISMGDFAPDGDYDKGNLYERAETLTLNMKILGPESVFSLHDVWSNAPAINPVAYLAEMRSISKHLDTQFSDWGFKDPRSCMLLDYWQMAIPDLLFVFVVRHPYEVWHHHRRYIGRRTRWFRRLLFCIQCMHGWHEYNQKIVGFAKALPGERYILMTYSSLMGGSREIRRLERFVSRKLSDVREGGRYRSDRALDLTLFLASLVAYFRFGVRPVRLYREMEALADRQAT